MGVQFDFSRELMDRVRAEGKKVMAAQPSGEYNSCSFLPCDLILMLVYLQRVQLETWSNEVRACLI